ncbi:carboxypeptidase-like regulatory domain-containing protein [Fluviicola sp.]|jgi:membrane-associated protease RseP (regulator of RpoE activity)|uniref:carboxypeptidase-like regulatory domain-containing protein n=1 Tax=Fluviicola sp. TaxID=1917219 RepID=UPI0028197AAD|nr:carboxypeptidase-like regulatory domain-containing protein [Fluviicola sp.]MDR0800931.1 carboxypeptidase-like regulatory domain-containing protein [Fluviicola sp.]
MRTITFITTLFLTGMTFAQNTFGDIIGTFVTPDKKEGVFGAYVITTRGDQVFKAITDEEGRFRISAVPAGSYKIYFIADGDTTYAPQSVEVSPDGFGNTGIVAQASAQILPGVDVVAPIYRLTTGVAPEVKLTAKDIKHMSIKFDAKKMVSAISSDVKLSDDGELIFRGARKGDVINYIDGVKMNDVQNVPSAALGYIMVYSGAIPAKYGDTTGGVVVMETLSYFDLLREYNNRP